VATISASAAAQNIIIFEFSLFVVNRSVANCVLSPSSANKTVVNIVRNILKVILSIFSSHNAKAQPMLKAVGCSDLLDPLCTLSP